jgi:hypothetical protein
MTLFEVSEIIRRPVEREPTPEERILISMMEKLSNAIKNIATNEGETK